MTISAPNISMRPDCPGRGHHTSSINIYNWLCVLWLIGRVLQLAFILYSLKNRWNNWMTDIFSVANNQLSFTPYHKSVRHTFEHSVGFHWANICIDWRRNFGMETPISWQSTSAILSNFSDHPFCVLACILFRVQSAVKSLRLRLKIPASICAIC